MSLTERKKFLSACSWAEQQTSTIDYHTAKLFQTCKSYSSNRANLNQPQRDDILLFLMFHLIFEEKKVVNLRGQLQGVLWKSSEHFINPRSILDILRHFFPWFVRFRVYHSFYIFQTISILWKVVYFDWICLHCLDFVGSSRLHHGWKGCKVQLISQIG